MNGFSQKLIVFVVGPSGAGKSHISNFLADLSGSLNNSEYHETRGVRILEIEKKISADPRKSNKWKEAQVEVEIWDCAGNPVFAPCWPSLGSNAHAVLFVIPPEGFHESELETWVDAFPHLKPNQMTIFFHKPNATQLNNKIKVKLSSKTLSKVNSIMTCVDLEPDAIKSSFDGLLSNAFSAILENRDKEERSIVG